MGFIELLGHLLTEEEKEAGRQPAIAPVPAALPEETQSKPGGFVIRFMAGRCANGPQRDQGVRYHALPTRSNTALCGAQPGRRSAGWAPWAPTAEEEAALRVTCPRCLSKLKNATPAE